MLFYSYEFVFVFLPLALCGFFLCARWSTGLGACWLGAVSLVFYGYWNVVYVPLILISITVNFLLARTLARRAGTPAGRSMLAVGVFANLALLGYFKYSNFIIATANGALGLSIPQVFILLPLGISVFTFTQIAYLNDVYRGIARDYGFRSYLLFVSYFPHLIAGPIIHVRQLIPQLEQSANYQARASNFSVGLAVFAIGMAKKVLLADSFAEYADPIFSAADHGQTPAFWVAWIGVMAYTLQIYFDFSGYTDMALGVSRLFGFQLPDNFDSPYRARNIIDFWRRWNITLSQFLRDYLYIPLGGNRRGPVRRHVNLTITMLLGGLWHGASWTFVIWGGLHAVYLMLNHAWLEMRTRLGVQRYGLLGGLSAGALTFLAVSIAWVFFRIESLNGAAHLLTGLANWHSPNGARVQGPGLDDYWVPQDASVYRVVLFIAGFALVWLAPNTRQLSARLPRVMSRFEYSAIGAMLLWIFVLVAVSAARHAAHFIYFNF